MIGVSISESSWLEFWCERRSLDRAPVLRSIMSGYHDDSLGGWGRIGYFWFCLTDHLEALSEWKLAEQAYHRARKLDPGNLRISFFLAQLIHERDGRKAEAERLYREIIDKDGTFLRPWNNLGNLLSSFDDRKGEAENAYREAIKRDDGYALPWNGLGNLLSQFDDRKGEAEDAYREAIKRDDGFASPWNNLGHLLSQFDDRRGEAENAFRKAIKRDETDPTFPLNLTELSLTSGKIEDAKHWLHKAASSVEADGGNRLRELWLLRLALVLGTGDTAAVQQAHTELLTLQKDNYPAMTWGFSLLDGFLQDMAIESRELFHAWDLSIHGDTSVAVDEPYQTWMRSIDR